MENNFKTFDQYIKDRNESKISKDLFNTSHLYIAYIEWLMREQITRATIQELLFQIRMISAYVQDVSQKNTEEQEITLVAVDPSIKDNTANDAAITKHINEHFVKIDEKVYGAVQKAAHQFFNSYTALSILASLALAGIWVGLSFAPGVSGAAGVLYVVAAAFVGVSMYIGFVHHITDSTGPEIKFMENDNYLKHNNRYLITKQRAIISTINPVDMTNRKQLNQASDIVMTSKVIASDMTIQNRHTDDVILNTVFAATKERFTHMYKSANAPCLKQDNGPGIDQIVNLSDVTYLLKPKYTMT